MAYIGVSPSNGVRQKHTYTATASQTTFTGSDNAENVTLSYRDSNYVDVYRNGVKLGDADYTATSGTSIVLGEGAAVNDIVEIVVYDVFSVADTVSKADGGTFDGNVTMAGTLAVTGETTLSANLNLGDNDKAIFGAGDDLQIYHDGSNSYIQEDGTGNLRIRATDLSLEKNAGGEYYLQATADGAVRLYYDGTQKLVTTSTGIDVTGTATMDGLTVDGTATITTTGNETQLTLTSTDADATTGPNMAFFRNSSSAADGDQTGSIFFIGKDDAGNDTTYGGITTHIVDASNTTEDGRLTISSMKAGTSTETLHVVSGNVGIGTSSPSQLLTVAASGSGARISITDTDTAASAMTGLLEFDGSDTRAGFVGFNAGNLELRTDDTDNIILSTNATERMRITSTNVGINTSSPTSGYMLHVGGSSGVHTKVKIEATTATGQAELDLSADPAGVSYLNLGDEDSYNIGRIGYFHSDNSMRFRTNSAERMRINSNGNVRIGTEDEVNLTMQSLFVQGSKVNFANAPGLAQNQLLVYDDTASTAGSGGAISFGANTGSSQRTWIAEIEAGRDSSSNDGSNYGGSLRFYTRPAQSIPAERMRISSGGQVSLATTDTTHGFNVGQSGTDFRGRFQGNNQYRLGLQNGTNDLVWLGSGGGNDFRISNSAGSNRFVLDGSGNAIVTIGTIGGAGSYSNTTGSGANVHILSSGVMVRSTSSLRYKNTINDATHGLTELLTLRPVTYKGNNDGDTVYGGLIAEEVHDAGLTEFVQYNDDGEPDALAYGNMVSLCIKSIQELKAELDSAKARIAALESNT